MKQEIITANKTLLEIDAYLDTLVKKIELLFYNSLNTS